MSTGPDMEVVRELIAQIPVDEIDAVLTVLALTGQLPAEVVDMTPQEALAYAVEKDPLAVADAALFVMFVAS